MTSRRRTTIVATICLVVSMAASVVLLRHIDEIRPPEIIEDALLLSVAETPEARESRVRWLDGLHLLDPGRAIFRTSSP